MMNRTIVELEIEALASGGEGIAHLDGKAVFVEQTARGDRILAEILEEKKGYCRGSMTKLLEPSPDRIQPLCPLYGTCGGCSLQHIQYEVQIANKRQFLKDAMERIAGFTALPDIELIQSAPWEYRNRMQFHRVPNPKAKLPGIGLKHRNGRDLVPVGDCPIANPLLRKALQSGALKPPVQSDRFTVYAQGNTLLAEGAAERGKVTILDKQLTVDVKGFFQSNASCLEKLILKLKTELATADTSLRAIDLYCGVGTFGAFLSDTFPRLDLVEKEKITLALARENVKGPEVRHFALSDDEWAKLNQKERYGVAVVDPPRVGLSPALKLWLGREKPGTLVYVSCDPATLARDTADLVKSGYRLDSLSCFDFYPHTPHIESLAILRSEG